MAVNIQFRRGTAAQWTSADPILAEGEMGIELDTSKFKIGNGVDIWSVRPYGGIVGATGPAGASGNSVLNGTTDPSSGDGNDGDFWINTTSDSIFGPKTGGAWGSGTSLIGATGPAGPTGATGATGPAGADATLEIQSNGSTIVAAPTTILDFSPNFTVTNPSGSKAYVDVAPDAARETIMPAGSTCAQISAAISAMASAGGGTVRLDGLMVMDGNITMASNVILAGYGRGTGLVNNTSNAYTIDFIGTTPTYYGIASPVEGADNFTCDTASEAGNFTAGTWVIINNNSSAPARTTNFHRVKTDGNTGTGVVEIFDNLHNMGFGSASDVAAPLIGALENSSLVDCEIKNASSGSITINIQYAVGIKLYYNTFLACTVYIDQCGNIDLWDNNYYAPDRKTHVEHISLGTYFSNVNIYDSNFREATYGIHWTGNSSAITTLNIYNNIFSVQYGIYLKPATTTACSLFELSINGNTFLDCEGIASGGGVGVAITTKAWLRSPTITGNRIYTSSGSTYVINLEYGTYQYIYFGNISDNIVEGTVQILACYQTVFSNNTISGGVILDGGFYQSVCSGNAIGGNLYLRDDNIRAVYRSSIINNYIGSTCYCEGDSSRKWSYNIFTGNTVVAAFNLYTHAEKNTISSNYFYGVVTITNGASGLASETNFSDNFCTNNVVFTEPNQSNCTITNNYLSGTITTLTGTGNIIHDRSVMQTEGARIKKITTVNAATYNLAATDYLLHVTYPSTAAVTNLQLMTAAVVSGRTIVIKDASGNAGTNNITITTEGSELIDGSATATINSNYGVLRLYSDGSNWFIV